MLIFRLAQLVLMLAVSVVDTSVPYVFHVERVATCKVFFEGGLESA